MSYQPHLLQKVALAAGKLSFVIALVSAIFLYIKVNELGMEHPISASFLASVFFFTFVGILLSIIGKSNIPDLKIRPSNNETGDMD